MPAGSFRTGAAGVEDKLVVPFWVMNRQGNEQAHIGDPQKLRALFENGMDHEPALREDGLC